jgi:hypothetical protein
LRHLIIYFSIKHFLKLIIFYFFSNSSIKLQWQSWSISQVGIPSDAVVAGHDKDGSALYVIRLRHGCNVYPGKYSVHRQQAYVSHDNREVTYDSRGSKFEVFLNHLKKLFLFFLIIFIIYHDHHYM